MAHMIPGSAVFVQASMVTVARESGAADWPDNPSARQKGSS